MKKLIVAVLGLFVAVFLTACGDSKKSDTNATDTGASANSAALDTIKANGVIRIGVFGDKPPFGYVNASGVNQGYDIVFAKRIAQELLGDENKVQFVLVEAQTAWSF